MLYGPLNRQHNPTHGIKDWAGLNGGKLSLNPRSRYRMSQGK